MCILSLSNDCFLNTDESACHSTRYSCTYQVVNGTSQSAIQFSTHGLTELGMVRVGKLLFHNMLDKHNERSKLTD